MRGLIYIAQFEGTPLHGIVLGAFRSHLEILEYLDELESLDNIKVSIFNGRTHLYTNTAKAFWETESGA